MAEKDQALADRLAAHVKPAGRSSRRPKPEGIRVRKPRGKGGATEAASPEQGTPVSAEITPRGQKMIDQQLAERSVAELKAIRMRAKWAAQRQERRIAKAKTPEEKAEAKTKTKELWEAERQAYAEYKAALKASKA